MERFELENNERDCVNLESQDFEERVQQEE